ncbi:restless-like transposase [Purpureocillium lavendulum]|uniref:Restless-like transposase n=1 Tax=Purpureocillium lavendulum TaxID=1247861 RepID=A0AB34FKQ0_9HYPO|nr:restless-like transposase [Purpureocillium lavendulum]
MLDNLPAEILQSVATWLSERDANALARASIHMWHVLDEYLYRRNVQLFDASSFHWALENGRTSTAKKAIDAGADVNSGKNGINDQLPLILAAKYSQLPLMKLLLAIPGIDVNPRDSKGRTPLSWAAGVGCADPISLLLASDGIHADAGDKGSRRPLWWAAALGRPTAVRLLLNSEQVTVDATDSSGQTALVAAAAGLGEERDVEECVQLLLAAGARPDARSTANRTPLSWAAGSGKLGVFKLVLVAMGHGRFEGWTVRDWVTARERDEMAKLLLGGSGI